MKLLMIYVLRKLGQVLHITQYGPFLNITWISFTSSRHSTSYSVTQSLSYSVTQQVTSLCRRAIKRLSRRIDSTLAILISAAGLEDSRLFWVKATQAAYFQDELALLRQRSYLPSSHPHSRLTAFIDNEGVLRVGGRLRRSELSYDTKHPAILPWTSRLSELIIAHAHKKMMHGGNQTTLVVSDYTSEGFISTYRRLTSRRGTPSALYSDCGTNFLGAEAQLKRCFTASSPGHLKFSALLAQDNTQWHFNPPAARHMGGKWEAAVKSLKFHVERTVGDTLLTYEEASTLLAQIEAILNSRPLEPLSDDPEDTTVLTSGYFLIETSLNGVTEHSLLDVSVNRLSRFQFIHQQMQQF
ncbi:uncharacterized protein LOC122521584 [Polistes fuscatus]|uniref:uncharacterized protein LOC122521584 n=1 Tax=Polistes fuscatus TaxID=30207 RepID=UPI001CA80705|nr:uncharacterized protein LOC122521584 [Polistes fuscatus]